MREVLDQFSALMSFRPEGYNRDMTVNYKLEHFSGKENEHRELVIYGEGGTVFFNDSCSELVLVEKNRTEPVRVDAGSHDDADLNLMGYITGPFVETGMPNPGIGSGITVMMADAVYRACYNGAIQFNETYFPGIEWFQRVFGLCQRGLDRDSEILP